MDSDAYWVIGLICYFWLSLASGIGWIRIAHESAYLWLTVSSVLVLARAASSSLALDKAPVLGEEKLDRLLAEYDVARVSVARNLMRIGSNAGASFALFVVCAGARDYIAEGAAAEEEGHADWSVAISGA